MSNPRLFFCLSPLLKLQVLELQLRYKIIMMLINKRVFYLRGPANCF